MSKRGRPPSVIWTEEMLETLRDMRSRGAPLFMCADRIGVAYATAVLKARSQKRLDVLVAAATHTTGPTGSVVPELIELKMN